MKVSFNHTLLALYFPVKISDQLSLNKELIKGVYIHDTYIDFYKVSNTLLGLYLTETPKENNLYKLRFQGF